MISVMRKDSSILFSSSTLLLLLLYWIVLGGNASAHFCRQEDDPLLMASTLGGVHDSQGASNSAGVEELARFAVDEHNKKEVKMFSLCSFYLLRSRFEWFFCRFGVFPSRISSILVDASVPSVPDLSLVLVVLCYGHLCVRRHLLRNGGSCVNVLCLLMRSVSFGVDN